MLLPDIPPQPPSLLFGLHFLVDMNRSGKEEIQQHPGDGGKPDAAEAERADIKGHAAHAEDDDQRDDGEVAGLHQVFASADQRVQAHHHDGPEEQDR